MSTCQHPQACGGYMEIIAVSLAAIADALETIATGAACEVVPDER